MMLKDLKLAAGAADTASTDTPLGKLAFDMYTSLSEDGHGGLDFSGVMKRIRGEL